MICFNCKTQIPDGISACPNCGAVINPPHQIVREVRVRRYQRWIFYAILALVFLAMTAYAVKIYTDNTALVTRISVAQQDLMVVQADATAKAQQVATQQTQIAQLEQNQQQLASTTEAFKSSLDSKTTLLDQYARFKVTLGAANASVYDFLVKYGAGMADKDLARIPVADYNLSSGADTDKDGLSDLVEVALGTDPAKADTDGDTFNDKEEVLNDYNPLGAGKLPIDQKFANQYKGQVLLQVDGKGEAWYVSPKDGKRYFLGRPAEALTAMQQLERIGL